MLLNTHSGTMCSHDSVQMTIAATSGEGSTCSKSGDGVKTDEDAVTRRRLRRDEDAERKIQGLEETLGSSPIEY